MITNNLKKFRTQNKYSLQEIADKLGMTRQNYWFLEKGERNITHKNQLKLCEIFRCSLNDLFDENVEYKNIENTNSFNFFSNIINSQYDDFLKIKKFKIINIDSFILDNTNDIIGTNMIYNYMFPTIGNNDIILINKNNKNIYLFTNHKNNKYGFNIL